MAYLTHENERRRLYTLPHLDNKEGSCHVKTRKIQLNVESRKRSNFGSVFQAHVIIMLYDTVLMCAVRLSLRSMQKC